VPVLGGVAWVGSWYLMYREITHWHHVKPSLAFNLDIAPGARAWAAADSALRRLCSRTTDGASRSGRTDSRAPNRSVIRTVRPLTSTRRELGQRSAPAD
jgi:hypothetical protein